MARYPVTRGFWYLVAALAFVCILITSPFYDWEKSAWR